MIVIGIDPGPTPGIVLLRNGRLTTVLQCNANSAPFLLVSLIHGDTVAVQIERFLPGKYSTKARGASAVTRDLIGRLEETVWQSAGVDSRIYRRTAANVKPWATDDRLRAADLYEPTVGMPHARDAARHAMFLACRNYKLPDPLSKPWGKL